MTLPPASIRAVVLRFPLRRVAILIVRERDGDGWLTLCGSHGWLSGSLDVARYQAKWLSRNFAVPVREIRA
jgi:hypothetical protein